MTEIVNLPTLTNRSPAEASERVNLKKGTLNSIFAAFNREGKATMVANNFDNNNDTAVHFITFRYAGSKRIRIQIEPYENMFQIKFGVLAESAPDDSIVSNHLLRKNSNAILVPAGIVSIMYGWVSLTVSNASIIVACQTFKDSGELYYNAGTVLGGYTAKHMITGERVMLIDDMLPGSDVAVGSTKQGIAIPRPSTLFAPQSDIMYSIPIINPSGDDAGFTGYFADGKFVFSNIHQYPVGTTVSIEGKLYSVVDTNYVAPLED